MSSYSFFKESLQMYFESLLYIPIFLLDYT